MPYDDYNYFISQRVHISARTFYWAFERCVKPRRLPGGEVQSTFTPAIICAAFSVELGLKALLLREGKEIKKTHNLEKLFEDLDPATQTQIRTETGVADADFASLLQADGNAFDEWRYIHEKEGVSVSPKFLPAMARATLTELDRTKKVFQPIHQIQPPLALDYLPQTFDLGAAEHGRYADNGDPPER